MDRLDCYKGAGCTNNITYGSYVCFSLGGYVTGNATCGDTVGVGFCQNVNQTAYVEACNDTGIFGSVCRSRGVKTNIKWAIFVLGLCFSFAAASSGEAISSNMLAPRSGRVLGIAAPVIDMDDCLTQNMQLLNTMEINETARLCDSIFRREPTGDGTTELVDRPCPTRQFTQVQVLKTGLYWGPWVPAATCEWCRLSSQACTEVKTFSFTTTVTHSVGFDVSLEGEVLDDIKGNAGFNFGYTWSTSITKTDQHSCVAGPGDVSQIWAQTLMGWSQNQARIATQECDNEPSFGPWTSSSTNWPIGGQGSDVMAIGCSDGIKNTDCLPIAPPSANS